jgi:hypothetical protein
MKILNKVFHDLEKEVMNNQLKEENMKVKIVKLKGEHEGKDDSFK